MRILRLFEQLNNKKCVLHRGENETSFCVEYYDGDIQFLSELEYNMLERYTESMIKDYWAHEIETLLKKIG